MPTSELPTSELPTSDFPTPDALTPDTPTQDPVRYFPIPRVWRADDPGLEAPPAEGGYEKIVTHPDGSVEITQYDPAELALGAPWPRTRDPDPDPDDVARRFAETRSDSFLFCREARTWFAWDGAIWRRDRGAVRQATIQDIIQETVEADAYGGQDVTTSGGPVPVRWVTAAEAIARDAPALAAGDWDADPWCLGTPGGTVDLVSGTLRPADPRDRITRATAIVPAETADCPAWRRFLDETTCGDAALTLFLHRFLGYALTGDTSEHVLLFGFGGGGNGKTVFANVVRHILGGYALVAAPDLLAGGGTRQARAPSGEIAMLAGARLVTASEQEEGQGWAEARIKRLTGGEPVTARHVGRDFVTFRPCFKLMVFGNHMPVLRSVDAALTRRLRVVPFAAQPACPDRTLEARLIAEAPAILRWMIEGALDWQAHGLGQPARVADATQAYLCSQDVVGLFLDDLCETAPSLTETAGALYTAWTAYAKAAGEPPGTQRRFAAALERHGLVRERTRDARVYRGVRLRRDAAPMD